MATATWYFSGDTATYQGTNWLTYTLNTWDGAGLPTNAYIKSITYGVNSYVGKYTTSSAWNFQLYAIAVDNGPYTGANYSTTEKPTTLIQSVDASIGSSTDTNIIEYTFQNGQAWVYGENVTGTATIERTHFDLIGCLFSNTTATSAFDSGQISVKLRLNNSGSGIQYITYISVTVEYETASLTAPGAPTITQDTSTGLWSASWDAAVGTNGSGDVTYTLFATGSDWSCGTSTSCSGLYPYDYLYELSFWVVAEYSGATEESAVTTYTFMPPLMATPTLTITPSSGDSATLSWEAPQIWYGSASSYDYIIQYSTPQATEIEYETYTGEAAGSQEIIIPTSWFEMNAQDGDDVYFTVTVMAHIGSYVAPDSDYDIISDTSESVPFTYDGKRTIAYYTGSEWKECVVYYYTGTEWKECIPYYYNGTNWIELKV